MREVHMHEIAVARNVFCAALQLVIGLNVYRREVGQHVLEYASWISRTLSDVYTIYVVQPWRWPTPARLIRSRIALMKS
jgi:hypothetical protein